MRTLTALTLLAAGAMALPAAAQYGPVVITGTVQSNTLAGGRFQGAQVGDAVRMTFRVQPGGFEPFWGPTGHFSPVDEASFEIHIDHQGVDSVCYSSASGTSILFINSGFVTTAVHDDEMEFFQMSLDSSMYHVYFKAQDYNDGIWDSPLVGNLPHITPSAPFHDDPMDISRFEVSDNYNPNMISPGPILVINFDGQITVPCRGDFNLDGSVTVQDIFDFLAAYFTNNTTADVNADHLVSVQDIFDFLGFYFRGC